MNQSEKPPTSAERPALWVDSRSFGGTCHGRIDAHTGPCRADDIKYIPTGQVAEAVAKLEEAKRLVAECCGSYFETGKPMFIDHEAKAKALAQLDAAIALLKEGKK